MFNVDTPQAIGLDTARWQHVLDLFDSWCAADAIPAATVLVAREGRSTGAHYFGRQTLAAASAPLREDAIFLVASITKPIVAMALLTLVERGYLSLGDRVREHVPEFGTTGKYGITVRNLLTHTSGLPDMLPNDRELRGANAPFSEFVEQIYAVKPDFPAGRGVRYQSMGFAMIGEIINRVTGQSYRDYVREHIFQPLGMNDSSLGAPESWFEGNEPRVSRIPEIRTPPNQTAHTDWNWNSKYWRTFGAPWGGLLTTPSDLARFAQMMLNGGELGGVRILSPATVAAATRNQLASMREVPEDERRCRPWGLGWRLYWPAESVNFGDLVGPRTYGHWGATGTALWIDPDLKAFAIILTTQPQEPHGKYLARATNAIAAAFV